MNRICVYTKDIQIITGKSQRHSRNLLNDMKIFYKKEKYQIITIDELCNYLGIEKALIINLLK